MFVQDINDPSLPSLILALEKAALSREESDFRAFVHFLSGDEAKLRSMAETLKTQRVALCLVPAKAKEETIEMYKINPKVRTTTIVYQKRLVERTFVNFEAKRDSQALERDIVTVCKKSKN